MSSETIPPPSEPEFQPDLTSNDPYAVLGLARGANERQAKRAYFTLIRTYTPETQPEAFKKIRAAYEQLRHADVKKETDLFLFQPPGKWEPRKRWPRLVLELTQADRLAFLELQTDLRRDDFPEDYRPIQL